jgi:putative ABC transport system substrate-binding protein
MKLPRRHLISGLGGALALSPWSPRALLAQPRPPLRVGTTTVFGLSGEIYASFRARMAELGYIEGRNFVFDIVAIERPAEYGAAYAELVARGVDVLLAMGYEPALQAARQAAAGRTPVVFLAVDYDPIQIGYVASQVRPGANITGIFVRQAELATKRLELAHEALPKVRRLVLWWDSTTRAQVEAMAAAAKTLGLDAQLVGVSGQPPDYENAFRLSDRLRADAIILTSSPAYFVARADILRLAMSRRLPVIAAYRDLASAGALLSYGIDLPSLFQDIASYVDRIARGAKPGDLPVGQPSKFDLVINLKTARTLDIAIPPPLRARAQVIE